MFASRRTCHLIHDSRGLRTYRMARAEVLEWLVFRTISVPQTAVRAILEPDIRVTWWRGLRADSSHPTGSISASERVARAPVSGLSCRIKIG
jgi:hypothetical protein